jgi:hypothetical protein
MDEYLERMQAIWEGQQETLKRLERIEKMLDSLASLLVKLGGRIDKQQVNPAAIAEAILDSPIQP